MPAPVKVVALLALHNRKRFALKSIRSLFEAADTAGISVQVFAVDAGSTDGTSGAVTLRFPQVQVVQTDSSSFWARSMRLAWEKSHGIERDFTLWLNEDVVLRKEAFDILLAASEGLKNEAIVVGATVDPVSGQLTYGGYTRGGPLRRMDSTRLQISESPQKSDFANGNILLVPDRIDRQLGGFPRGFIHAMADFAFTIKASRRGIPIMQAPGWVGYCSNPPRAKWTDPSRTPSARWRLLFSPKGLPPLDWLRLSFLIGGVMAPFYFLKPYFSLGLTTLLSGPRSAAGPQNRRR